MASVIVAMKGTKYFKTGAKGVKTVQSAGKTISDNQKYFTVGQKALSLFGFGGSSPEQIIMDKLDQMHKDMKQGFVEVHEHLDEMMLSSYLIDHTTEINGFYTEINSICKNFADGPERDGLLTQLLEKSTGHTIIEDPIALDMSAIKQILLGEAHWTISDPAMPYTTLIADKEYRLVGDDRYQYMNGAIMYYSSMLEALYNGLFVINFTEAFFNQSGAGSTPSANVLLKNTEYVIPVEEASPFPTYQPYFEMRLFGVRPPNDTSNTNWLMFTSGECLIYDFKAQSVKTGPHRIGQPDPPGSLNGFQKLPSNLFYPDSVYDQRSKAGVGKYDEHYFFFKGDQHVDYLWDNQTNRTFTTPQEFLGLDGVVASMQNPHASDVYLISNIKKRPMKSFKMDRSWYDDANPSYQSWNGADQHFETKVDGGGGHPDGRKKFIVFMGKKSMTLTEVSGPHWDVSDVQNVWELLPGLAGDSSCWHIEEMMDRET